MIYLAHDMFIDQNGRVTWRGISYGHIAGIGNEEIIRAWREWLAE